MRLTVHQLVTVTSNTTPLNIDKIMVPIWKISDQIRTSNRCYNSATGTVFKNEAKFSKASIFFNSWIFFQFWPPFQPSCLPLDETTIGDQLKSHGYRTHIGKYIIYNIFISIFYNTESKLNKISNSIWASNFGDHGTPTLVPPFGRNHNGRSAQKI